MQNLCDLTRESCIAAVITELSGVGKSEGHISGDENHYFENLRKTTQGKSSLEFGLIN